MMRGVEAPGAQAHEPGVQGVVQLRREGDDPPSANVALPRPEGLVPAAQEAAPLGSQEQGPRSQLIKQVVDELKEKTVLTTHFKYRPNDFTPSPPELDALISKTAQPASI